MDKSDAQASGRLGRDYFIAFDGNPDSKVVGQAVRDLSAGVTLLQAGDATLGIAERLLLEVRGLSEQSASAQSTRALRLQAQVEASNLLDRFDDLGQNTRIGDIAPFDGQVSSLRFRTRVRGGEDISIDVPSLSSQTFSAAYLFEGESVDPQFAIESGTLTVNGVEVRATTSADDIYSIDLPGGSVIAKARVINEIAGETGVRAVVRETRVRGEVTQGGRLDANNAISINGQNILGFDVEPEDNNGRLRGAINAVSDVTGVVADMVDGQLTLIAPDGRNITVSTSSQAAAQRTGLNAGRGVERVYAGALTLQSNNEVDVFFREFELSDALGFGPVIGQQTLGSSSRLPLRDIDLLTTESAREANTVLDSALGRLRSSREDFQFVRGRVERAVREGEAFDSALEVRRRRVSTQSSLDRTLDFTLAQLSQLSDLSILAQANSSPKIAAGLLDDRSGLAFLT